MVSRHRLRLLAWLLLLLLAAACSRPAPPSAAEPVATPAPTPEPAPVPAPPVKTPANPTGAVGAQADPDAARAGPGWQKVLTGAYTLARVEPDGQGFYLKREGGEQTQRVRLGDPVSIEQVEAPPESSQILSPDATRAAWVEQGRLVVEDLRSGERRVLTTPPEPAPPNLVRYQYWTWVGSLYWSPDGQWLYFTSTRTDPSSFRFWRVPVDGSRTEELVPPGNQVFITGRGRYGPILRMVDLEALHFLPETGTDRRPVDPGEHLDLNLSPDGRQVAVYLHKGGRVVIYNLDQPAEPVLSVQLPEGSWVVENAYFTTSAWSPDGQRVLLQLRAAHRDLAQWIALLEARPGGKLTLYGLDDPTLGLLQPLGWVNPAVLVVRSSQWDQRSQWPKAEHTLFLVDLLQVRPPLATAPENLVAVRISGGTRQDGQQPKADEATLLGEGEVILKFDRPLSPEWVHQHISVDGPGARVVASAASLGLVMVRLEKGKEGETVLVRVAPFDHSVRIQRAEPARVSVEMRRSDGSWGPLDPTRIHPRSPTEFRFRFNKPVHRELAENLVHNGLPAGKGAVLRWSGNDLLVQAEEPPEVLRWRLEGDLSHDGTDFEVSHTPPLFFGSPPRLMAGEVTQPGPALPPSIETAHLSPDGRSLLLRWYHGEQSIEHSRVDLPSGIMAPISAEEAVPSGRRHGDRVAVLSSTFVGSGGVYRYEPRVVVTEDGREVLRSEPMPSYYPPGSYNSGADFAWSPDGREIAVVLPSAPSDHRLYLVDTSTGTVRPLGDSLKDGGQLLWSPGGRFLLVGRQVVEYTGGQVIHTLEHGLHHRWSPTEEQILYNRQEWGEVAVLTLTSGEVHVLGRGLPAGWDASARPLWIVWDLAERRIRPFPGP